MDTAHYQYSNNPCDLLRITEAIPIAQEVTVDKYTRIWVTAGVVEATIDEATAPAAK